MTSSLILLVDDYADALEVWTMYLQTSGFNVAPAATGADALAIVQQRVPQAAVLDLQLPDMSGLDLARVLRSRNDTCAMPLIALTGRTLPAEIEAAKAAGFEAVLIKPCDPGELLATIHRALSAAT